MDREALLHERNILRRKLHLAELRLSARDAELSYLYEAVKTNNSHPSYYPHHPHPSSPSTSARSPKLPSLGSSASSRRGPPYLFQQQYSPKMRHEIKPPTHQKHHMSALESLGIVADRMLSDPEFNSEEKHAEQQPASHADRCRVQEDEAIAETKRSKRSIDSANTLLSMPSLMFPKLNENQGKSIGSFK